MTRKMMFGVMMVLVCAGMIDTAGATEKTVPSYHKYTQSLRRYIKRRQEYSLETFRADLIWGALYIVPQVRNVLWQRESWITERDARIDSVILPQSKVRGTQFVVGIYAPEGTDKFDMEKDSFWQLKMNKDGQEYDPISIEPLPNDVLEKRLIPFTHHWAKLYLVTYAGQFKPPFKLRMVGNSAKSVINWPDDSKLYPVDSVDLFEENPE